jgi:predicted nuclease of predicted toxin-antitoxin system
VANGLTIVTKDTDSSVRVMATASGPRVIHFRTGNLPFQVLHELVESIWLDVCHASEMSRLVQIYRDRIETLA